MNPRVVAEVIITGGGWTVLAGLEEVAHLLAGKDVNVYAMPEGTIFYPYEPVLRIEGRYLEFARYETPLLGFLCHESGIATKAAWIKLLAGEVPVIFIRYEAAASGISGYYRAMRISRWYGWCEQRCRC